MEDLADYLRESMILDDDDMPFTYMEARDLLKDFLTEFVGEYNLSH
jgi:hypothetical protein